MTDPEDRGRLLTERGNPRSARIDRMTIVDAFDVMHAEDRTVADAVGRAKDAICATVEMAIHALEGGGRLVYVGAGTSGRLGAIDAAECPPTFRSSPDRIQAIVAGGPEAMLRSVEGAEDSRDDGAAAIRGRGIGAGDVVVGITAGGSTPFVLGALHEARCAGARTALVTCVEAREGADEPAEVVIRLLTGPEVVAGSTRLKAGTATKMALNAISTLAMIQLGKVYGNLMVDLDRTACAKLRDRAVRIVEAATGLERQEAAALLEEAGDVKTAVVMHGRGVGSDEARRLLREAGGRIHPVLDG